MRTPYTREKIEHTTFQLASATQRDVEQPELNSHDTAKKCTIPTFKSVRFRRERRRRYLPSRKRMAYKDINPEFSAYL